MIKQAVTRGAKAVPSNGTSTYKWVLVIILGALSSGAFGYMTHVESSLSDLSDRHFNYMDKVENRLDELEKNQKVIIHMLNLMRNEEKKDG